MNFRGLLILVAIAFIGAFGVTIVFVQSGAQVIQESAYTDVAQAEYEDPYLRKGLFGISEPTYTGNTSSCQQSQSQAYISTVMHYLHTPRSCEVFVDNTLTTIQRSLKPTCLEQCPNEEFTRTFYLGALNHTQPHEVRVCCNDICISQELPAKCSS